MQTPHVDEAHPAMIALLREAVQHLDCAGERIDRGDYATALDQASAAKARVELAQVELRMLAGVPDVRR